MASYPLNSGQQGGDRRHLGQGRRLDVITPDMITSANVKVEKGDILILHTGYHRYYEAAGQDLVRYFCRIPVGQGTVD